ncbi:hypothetical protein BC938DRAFT_476964 [Jimgerdemannia flammicorona]|uniref:Uncharacterized protein n=1 Tax=Jimgerdemannia flammicorona TaxID=994334 RepID=A0A433PCZ9_9FUNG|nr:hypothetical protein BC938DRAFT_476964 [Jimgerdemannia flammicorona]
MENFVTLEVLEIVSYSSWIWWKEGKQVFRRKYRYHRLVSENGIESQRVVMTDVQRGWGSQGSLLQSTLVALPRCSASSTRNMTTSSAPWKGLDWVLGLSVRLKTVAGEEVDGRIYSYDPVTNCVALDIL